jgi:hypothetical protein
VTGLQYALLALRQALESPRRHHVWRWLVRHRIAAVRDVLVNERQSGGDAWLAARELVLHQERSALLRRLATLGSEVFEAPDVEPVRQELLRLVSDLERHHQHLNDLVYDSVSLELGGSD